MDFGGKETASFRFSDRASARCDRASGIARAGVMTVACSAVLAWARADRLSGTSSRRILRALRLAEDPVAIQARVSLVKMLESH